MTPRYLAAIQSASLRQALFVEANFTSGPIYVWSGVGPIALGGKTWTGLGLLGNVSMIEESATVEAKGITLTLSGIDSTMLAGILEEFQVGLPAIVALGLFDAAGALIGDQPETSANECL
jgi:hypothetical protein